MNTDSNGKVSSSNVWYSSGLHQTIDPIVDIYMSDPDDPASAMFCSPVVQKFKESSLICQSWVSKWQPKELIIDDRQGSRRIYPKLTEKQGENP